MWSEKSMHDTINKMSVWIVGIAAYLLMTMTAQAMMIQGVSLLDAPSGEILRIEGDSALKYEVFDLDGPPRMIISFPGAGFKEGLNPIRSTSGVVTSVFPVDSADGVRLEIGLSSPTAYDVKVEDDTLIIKFVAKEDGANVVASHAVISDVQVKNRGNATELTLSGSDLKENHNAFMTNDHHTLILDFWGGSTKLVKDNYKFSSRYIQSVTVGQAEGRVRFVINLLPTSEMKYQVDATNGEMIVRIGSDVGVEKKSTSEITVESVDFQPDDRIGRIVVRTSEQNPIVNVHEENGNIIIDLSNAKLAEGQERSQDLKLFPGPVTQIDSYKNANNVRVVARLRTDVNITTYQQGNVLTVNLEPKDMVTSVGVANQNSEFAYIGEKVTFNFKDIEIRNVLTLIAEMSDKNLIMTDDVKGTLTMRLDDVPWDQALDIIINAKGLGKQEEGNVVRIAPIAVIEAENIARLAAKTSQQKLDPLITEFIRLGYVSGSEVKTLLKPTGSGRSGKSGGKSSSGLLSDRGTLMIDERSNTLILTDTQDSINAIKRLIEEVDKPVGQVLIEARIVEASDSFSQEIGIRWGGNRSFNSGGRPGVVRGGASDTTYTDINTGASQITPNLIDLPAAVGTGAGGAIQFLLGGSNFNLDLELSAAEADGDAKVVSNPRVLTSNLQEALIEDEQTIPFSGKAIDGTATSTTQSASLSLKVTPQITADKRIILDLEVKKGTPLANTLVAGGEPIINTKTVKTKLIVDNGETIVLGGIYEEVKDSAEQGVPLLMNIPLIGYIFKHKSTTSSKKELLIFVTPTIVNGYKPESH